MATQVQFRRGTTTQNNAFTGAIGEITYDTEVKTLRLHDGSNAGGGAVVVNTASAQTLTNKTLSTGSTWNGNAVALAYGGTGASLTAVNGGIAYSTGSAMALSAAGTSGQVLTSGGAGAPTWVNAASITAGSSTNATYATNIAGGSAGQLVIQQDTGLTTFITAGDSGTFLRSAGAGYAPTWATANVTIGTTAIDLGGSSTSLAGLNILAATGTSHWTIPVGTTAQRPASPAVGMIRYNSSQTAFEGYAAGAWSSLGGVKSVDGYTYILAETSPTAGNGDLDFYAENSAGNAATQVGQWNRTNLKDYTGTIVGTQTTQNIFNTTATTVNAYGAATTLTIGATTGTATIRNATVAITNAATIGSTLGVTGATTLSSTLAVTSNATVGGNLTVTGNLTINGTTTTVNSTTVTVDDPIFTLGGDTTPATDDNKDRGIEFRWHNGTAAKVGFFGYDDSTGKFTFIPDATNTSEVFAGTAGPAAFGAIDATTVAATGDITSPNFYIYSDARLKDNIQDSSYGLAEVMKLQSVQYDINGRHEVGLIAQNVEEHMPEFVSTDADGKKKLDYAKMVSVLVKTVQQQQEQIDQLKAKLGN